MDVGLGSGQPRRAGLQDLQRRHWRIENHTFRDLHRDVLGHAKKVRLDGIVVLEQRADQAVVAAYSNRRVDRNFSEERQPEFRRLRLRAPRPKISPDMFSTMPSTGILT